ncbi:MAG: SDR family oxidoreductase [Pseudomonadota bacterium]
MTFRTDTAFIFGLGYSAQRLIPLLKNKAWTVFATARRNERVEQLTQQSIHPVLLADGQIDPKSLPGTSHLIISAPPDSNGCPAFQILARTPIDLSTVTYLSTTGVYGDRGGGWVDETAEVAPVSKRAANRVKAETQWLAWCEKRDIPFRTVRLPGIYGPGRSAFDRLKAGRARRIIKKDQVFSRIHVEDLASGVMALLEKPHLSGVFHLCDSEPAPPQDVIAFAANLMGAPVPPDLPIEAANLSPMAASFYAECKRVSSQHTRDMLSWTPVFDDYRSGLTAIWEQQKNPG